MGENTPKKFLATALLKGVCDVHFCFYFFVCFILPFRVTAFNYLHVQFLANVNSSSCSLYVVVRPSVCLSSVVCLSVTFVRPTQAIELFGTFSSPFGTLAIC